MAESEPKPVEGQIWETWPEFFMTMAFFVGMKSKDKLTKVGAVIATPEHQVVSVGYNGFPRGVNDKKMKRHERPLKYMWTIHAERNAIYNAHFVGASVKKCTLYTPWFSCPTCAETIINSGISRIVHYYPASEGMGHQSSINTENRENWAEIALQSQQMFEEAGVVAELYCGPLYCGGIIQVANGVVGFPSSRMNRTMGLRTKKEIAP